MPWNQPIVWTLFTLYELPFYIRKKKNVIPNIKAISDETRSGGSHENTEYSHRQLINWFAGRWRNSPGVGPEPAVAHRNKNKSTAS
jgi:hypothetical protein